MYSLESAASIAFKVKVDIGRILGFVRVGVGLALFWDLEGKLSGRLNRGFMSATPSLGTKGGTLIRGNLRGYLSSYIWGLYGK